MKKILLIEDNEDIRENTAEILELANYNVLTAADGKDGVTKAIEHTPDLIICDIMMPVLDGYGVLYMLQKNKELQNTPFIFLTAKTERTDIRKGMDAGADDYITKPFNGTDLLSAVESRIKKWEAVKENNEMGLEGVNRLVRVISGEEALNNLVAERTTNKYKKKQRIYSEGNYPSRIYYVLSGKVRSYKMNDDGKELVVGLYNAGEFLGYTALLENTAYKESAEALADTELAIIPRDEFEMLVNSNVQVMAKFIKLLANDVTNMEQQLLNIAYNSLRKKVSDALMAIYEKYNPEQRENFQIDLTRENLAAIAGTAKESMIRTLSDFKDEGLIDIKTGKIIMLQPHKLRSMLN